MSRVAHSNVWCLGRDGWKAWAQQGWREPLGLSVHAVPGAFLLRTASPCNFSSRVTGLLT